MQASEPSELEVFLVNLAYTAPDQRQKSISESKWSKDLTLHSDFNKEHFAAVTHESEKTLFNLHRGTAAKDDLYTDTRLAVNQLQQTNRFKNSERHSVMSAYKLGPGKKIVEMGHSLGGALAEEIAQKYDRPSVALNMGTTPLKSYGKVDRTKHRHHRIGGDPISAFDPTASTKHSKTGVQTVHERLWNRRKTLNHHWEPIQRAVKSHTLASFA